MTKATNRILKITFCVLFAIIAIVTVNLQYGAGKTFAADDTPATASSPTFEITGGQNDAKGDASYLNVYDGKTDTKYCIDIKLNPYIIFRASDVSATVTGYKLYTGNDTSTHVGRNPKAWTLYEVLTEQIGR